MKKYLLLINLLLTLTIGYAQTQYGYVKTKGRLTASGTVIPGARLAGATITLNTRNVVTLDKGAFSFPTSGKSFLVKDIKKNGYQLYDRDQLKSYTYSSNPLILVLEKPEEYEQDKLQKQQQISRTLRRQLAKREDEIERLKEEKKISEQEYQRLYNELYSNDKKNQELIEDMAKRYALMDFDNMDETNLKIKTYILNGELERADSLINSKGSLEDRKKEFLRMQEANKQEETAIAQRQENLNKSKELAKKTLLDLTEDYMNKFEVCKLQNKYDSAAYYIEERASLDTTNDEWQFDAATYFYDQNEFDKSELYWLSALKLLEKQNSPISKNNLATVKMNLGNIYIKTLKLADCEAMYNGAIEIWSQLSNENSKTYEPCLAKIQQNLGVLYYDTQRYLESENKYKAALSIYQRLDTENPKTYKPELATIQMNLGSLYLIQQKYTESESSYKEALKILEHLAKENKKVYEPNLAKVQMNLGSLYLETNRLSESESIYKTSLEILERLAKENSKAYETLLATIQMNLGNLYLTQQKYAESENMYNAALAIRQRQAKENPKVYEPDLAKVQMNLGILYSNIQDQANSKKMLEAALEILARLAKDNFETYEPNLTTVELSLGMLYSNSQKLEQAETMFKSALKNSYRKSKENPQKYEAIKALTYLYLYNIYSQTNKYNDAYYVSNECVVIWQKSYKIGSITKEQYATCLNNLSFYCNALGKFEEGEKHSREALAVDSTLHLAYTNLAASLLMQGKYTEAEKIYIQYKGELKDGFLDDLKVFVEQGVIPKEREADVERIKQLLTWQAKNY